MRVIEDKDGGESWTSWPLDSSVFASAGYPLPRARFHTGELYCYFDFPPQRYRDFMVNSLPTYHQLEITNARVAQALVCLLNGIPFRLGG